MEELINLLNKKDIRCIDCDSYMVYTDNVMWNICEKCGTENECSNNYATYKDGHIENLEDYYSRVLFNKETTDEEKLQIIEEELMDRPIMSKERNFK